MSNEIWKDIIGYEGYYQISSFGRVRSLKRIIIDKNNNKHTINEKILKPHKSIQGYLTVSLLKIRNNKRIRIHRLVALHFIENINNYSQVNHKDFNRENNNVDNLEWMTPSQNVKYSWDNGRYGDSKLITKEANKKCSKKVLCVDLNTVFESARKASREFNIAISSISQCCNKKRKSAGGYKWQYL